MTSARRTSLAVLFSLIAPGLGHLYVGRPKTALTVAIAVPAVGGLALSLFWLFLPVHWFTVVLGFLAMLSSPLATAMHAGSVAHRIGSTYELRPYNRGYIYLAAFLMLTLWYQAGLSLAKSNLGAAFRIPSPTMEPALLVGDHIWVAKLPRSLLIPERGSMIVFVSVEESTPNLLIVKRVVGISGDTLRMVWDTLYRNGQRLDEPYASHLAADVTDAPEHLQLIRAWQLEHYVGHDADSYQPTTHNWGPIVVPPDHFFAMGDNRDQSYDSRYYGFVPTANARGRPRLVYLSRDPATGGFRWSRIGRAVH